MNPVHRDNICHSSDTAKEIEVAPQMRGRLVRLIGWWLGLTWLISMSGMCPFCGRAGCVVGGVNAGGAGALFALLMQNWKLSLARLRFRKRRQS